MPINCSKIKSYIGFAKRSRQFILGISAIEKYIGSCEIILFSSSLARSSAEKLLNLAKKKNVLIFCLDQHDMTEIVENANIKAIAITDKNLSAAIKNVLD